MATLTPSSLIQDIRNHAVRLTGSIGDYTPLLEMIDDARCVVLGELPPDNAECARIRTELTTLLLYSFGFKRIDLDLNDLRVILSMQGPEGCYGDPDTRVIGFSTPQEKTAEIFHATGLDNFLLILRENESLRKLPSYDAIIYALAAQSTFLHPVDHNQMLLPESR